MVDIGFKDFLITSFVKLETCTKWHVSNKALDSKYVLLELIVVLSAKAYFELVILSPIECDWMDMVLG